MFESQCYCECWRWHEWGVQTRRLKWDWSKTSDSWWMRAIIDLSPHLWRKELLLQRHQSQQHPLPLQLVLLPGSRQGTSSTGPKADAALQLQWHQRRPAVRAVGAAEKANVAEKSFKACISMTIEFFFSNVLPLFSNPSPTFLQSPYKFI